MSMNAKYATSIKKLYIGARYPEAWMKFRSNHIAKTGSAMTACKVISLEASPFNLKAEIFRAQ